MKIFRDKAHEGLTLFYMTMIGMIQSLVLGYLATSIDLSLLIAPVPPIDRIITFLGYLLALQMIVVVWHEYAVATMCFGWPPGYSDSWIPILLGLSEFFVIKCATISSVPLPISGGSPVPFLMLAYTMFALLGLVAYMNQYRKVTRHGDLNKSALRAVAPAMRFNLLSLSGLLIFIIIATIIAFVTNRTAAYPICLAAANATMVAQAIRGKVVFDRIFK